MFFLAANDLSEIRIVACSPVTNVPYGELVSRKTRTTRSLGTSDSCFWGGAGGVGGAAGAGDGDAAGIGAAGAGDGVGVGAEDDVPGSAESGSTGCFELIAICVSLTKGDGWVFGTSGGVTQHASGLTV